MADDVFIACRQLTLGYGNTPILEGVDFEIRRGEIVSILGGSGSGKSTLLKAIVGLLPPLAGVVELYGQNVYTMDRVQRRELLRRTGMLFQQDALFGSMNVLDNVALPLRETTKLPEPIIIEMARMRLSLVGLGEYGDRLPEQLSGGQRKRVALARASILDPDIIFCDEPTSGLDPVTAAQLDDTLLRFREALGNTIVAVTHDLGSIRMISDWALMLGEGRLRAAGTIAELEASDDPAVIRFLGRESALRKVDQRDVLREVGAAR